jgi:hypothetical protein
MVLQLTHNILPNVILFSLESWRPGIMSQRTNTIVVLLAWQQEEDRRFLRVFMSIRRERIKKIAIDVGSGVIWLVALFVIHVATESISLPTFRI